MSIDGCGGRAVHFLHASTARRIIAAAAILSAARGLRRGALAGLRATGAGQRARGVRDRRTTSALARIQITFRCGALAQTPETAGVFHLYEHMLFRATGSTAPRATSSPSMKELGCPRGTAAPHGVRHLLLTVRRTSSRRDRVLGERPCASRFSTPPSWRRRRTCGQRDQGRVSAADDVFQSWGWTGRWLPARNPCGATSRIGEKLRAAGGHLRELRTRFTCQQRGAFVGATSP